jgi:hypothetical protein
MAWTEEPWRSAIPVRVSPGRTTYVEAITAVGAAAIAVTPSAARANRERGGIRISCWDVG